MAMMAINAVISQLPDAVARREFRARLNLVSYVPRVSAPHVSIDGELTNECECVHSAVDSLRSAAASDAGLAMQLNIFDQWSDERRMSVHENENDLQRASRVLKSKVLESHLIHAYFASILDHMVLLPCNGPQSLVYWEMIDRFVVHSASTSFNADKLAFAQEITDSVIRQLQTSSSWPPENLAELAGAAPPSTTAAAQEGAAVVHSGRCRCIAAASAASTDDGSQVGCAQEARHQALGSVERLPLGSNGLQRCRFIHSRYHICVSGSLSFIGSLIR